MRATRARTQTDFQESIPQVGLEPRPFLAGNASAFLWALDERKVLELGVQSPGIALVSDRSAEFVPLLPWR